MEHHKKKKKKNFYSFFKPNLPTLRSPNRPIQQVNSKQPRQAQKTARYPSNSASGVLLLSLFIDEVFLRCVTDEEMTAMMAIPTEVPNWATVLNTAPARACVSTGKTSVIKMLETVKRTIKSFNGISFWTFILFWEEGKEERKKKKKKKRGGGQTIG